MPFESIASRYFHRFQFSCATEQRLQNSFQMIDDQDLGFFANFLGIFIFIMVAEHVSATLQYRNLYKHNNEPM